MGASRMRGRSLERRILQAARILPRHLRFVYLHPRGQAAESSTSELCCESKSALVFSIYAFATAIASRAEPRVAYFEWQGRRCYAMGRREQGSESGDRAIAGRRVALSSM